MMHCYPKFVRKGQSFAGVKRVVVPRQSMTLQEIITRFVKREALPVVKEGIYEDRFPYDLEKLAHEDRTLQDEVLEDLKSVVKEGKERESKQAAADAAKLKAQKDAERAKWLEELKQSDPIPPKQ